MLVGSVLAVSSLAWWILERILASDRGVDLSDEGLYLLAADPPSPSASWGFPSGWHLHPLFVLVRYDIASFRTLGAVILVGSSVWLGWSAGRVALAREENSVRSSSFLTLAAAAGGVGSLLFYAPMLRTPSYNWSNLVGLTVAAAAALTAVSLAHGLNTTRSDRATRTWFAMLAGVSSLALFSTFPAKPTTLPFMLLLTTMLVLLTVNARTAGAWAVLSVALMPIWLGLAYLLRVWPGDALEVFRLALQMPAPDPLQTTGTAIRAALLVPMEAVSSLRGFDLTTVTLVLIGLIVAAIPVVRHRDWIGMRLGGFAISAVGALALAGVPIPGLHSGLAPFTIANSGVTTACNLVLVGAVLAASRRPSVSADRAPRGLTRWSVVALLSILPFVFAFGSGNGIYAQASLAAGTVLLAGVVAVPRPMLGNGGLAIALAAGLTTATFATGAVVGGWQSPFRAAALVDQTVPTEIGSRGSMLLLDPRIAGTIAGLRSKAEEVGWTDGTPIVDVSFTWNPTVPYALGGRVPDFLALTIFGYPAAHDITDFHLTEPYLDFPYYKAWFVTSRPTSISDPNGQAGVDFTMEKLTTVTGRPFPDSYACVTAGDFILWRPLSSEEARQACES